MVLRFRFFPALLPIPFAHPLACGIFLLLAGAPGGVYKRNDEKVMEVFAVQTYFSTEFLAFFETLLQIRRPVLVGNQLMENVSLSGVETPLLPPNGVDTDNNAPSVGGVAEPTLRENAGEGDNVSTAAEAAAAAAASEAKGKAENGSRRGGVGGGVVPPTGQFDMLRVVSRSFQGKRYDVLARELILKGAMPLGLYRPAGTKGCSLPYTQVNPSIAEPLVDGDMVFVLRSRSCCLVGSV